MTRIAAWCKNTGLPLMLCLLLALQAGPVFADSPTAPSSVAKPGDYYAPDGSAPIEDVTDIDACTSYSGYMDEQITSRVVFCIRSAVYAAVATILADLSDYMWDTTVVAMALAVAVFGIRVLGGEAEINARAMGVMFRLGLVYMFAWNLGNLGYWIFGIMDWLVDLVVPFPGWTPWEQIDAFIGRLLGFAPGLSLANGIIGVAFATALSITTGTAMFGMMLLALFDLIMFVLEIVYSYLTAMLVVGFMIIISPLIIPFALFNISERYFKKWSHVLIGALLVPMLLFGFLSIALNVFDTLIQEVISVMSNNMVDGYGNPVFDSHWRIDQPKGSWLLGADPGQVQDIQERSAEKLNEISSGREKEVKIYPPIGTEINPFGRVSMNMTPGNFFGTSYTAQEVEQMLYRFIALWVYAKLIMGLVKKMPEIAQAISAGVLISFRPGRFRDKAREVSRNFGFGAGALLGGGLGSAVGGAAGGNRMRSLGAVAGIGAGGMMGERFLGSMGDKFGEALAGKFTGQVNKQIGDMVGRR